MYLRGLNGHYTQSDKVLDRKGRKIRNPRRIGGIIGRCAGRQRQNRRNSKETIQTKPENMRLWFIRTHSIYKYSKI